MRKSPFNLKIVLNLAAASGLLLTTALDLRASASDSAKDDRVSEAAVSEKPFEQYRIDLLELSFDAATAIPIKPHINDRARAQEAVVAACLELDQPQRALGYIPKIRNWRRGTALADLAFHCVQRDDELTAETKKYLDDAARFAEGEGDWRRDRIRVHIARSYAWLGQTDHASALEWNLAESEQGKVDAARAMKSDEDTFMQQVIALDALIAAGDMDRVKNGLEAYTQLYGRFYDNVERRDRIEKTIRTNWGAIPLVIHVDLMMDLAEYASEHKDHAKALELIGEAQSIVDSYQWAVEDHMPLLARLVILRHQAGEVEIARNAAYDAMTLFEQRRETTYDFYRADALLAMAEAHQAIGDAAKAREIYLRAIAEGSGNPNSRIRALSLSAVCRSLALHAVEPDVQMWTRLRQIREGLGDPW